MVCPACQTENPANAHFCKACGKAVAPACPQCGAPASADARHCIRCGVRLSRQTALEALRPPGPDAAAERRQLTVLFCDLVGSTTLARTLGDKYLGVLRSYLDASEVVIRRFDGYVAQRLGDGLLVYFGYPMAHDDDANRAVLAGLEILEALRRRNEKVARVHGVRLMTRIGIDTGVVVAGELGAGGRTERLAVGEAPNLASRLKDAAEPGSLVVSESTRRLVEGFFAMRDLGTRELKGVGPTAVYEVLRQGTARSRLEVMGPAGLTPLVGRHAEVGVLRERWNRVKAGGQGEIVLLCGEPGIGKSRLVRMLEEYVAEDPGSWLTRCACSPHYQNTAFYPIVDFIERVALKFTPEESADSRRRKLEEWLVHLGLALDEAVPLFARLLSLPVTEGEPRAEAGEAGAQEDVRASDPRRQKQKTMELLAGILLARAAEQPLLFVCEDLHWADPSTLELLALLVRDVRTARILIALTFRPEFAVPWAAPGDLSPITLSRLGPQAAGQIAKVALGGKEPPRSLVEQILARTGGNPLFIEELCRMVRDAGLLREVDGRFELAGPLPAHAIPATLRDSLMARLDRLGEAREVVQLSALLGREFSYALLRAVSGRDEESLHAALARIVEAELVYPSRDPSDQRYVFKHALIQDAAYDTLLLPRRQRLHRQVAAVIRKKFADVALKQPELIAHHYTESDRPWRSLEFWRRAGVRALERAANVEAIAHLEQALHILITSLKAGRCRDAREIELQHALAPAYMAIKGWASVDVERACRRALELSGAQGDFGSLWGLWTNHFLRGRLDAALDTALQVLALAEGVRRSVEADVPNRTGLNLEVMARHAVGYSHFYRGDFADARAEAEAGLALQLAGPDGTFNLDAEREIVLTFQFSSSAALRMMRGCSLWMLGYPDQAPAVVESAIALTRELKHYPSEAYALGTSLLLHHYRLDVERAAATATRLLTLARQESFELWTPWGLMFRGWILAEHGQAVQGVDEINRNLRRWQNTGTILNQTIIVSMLARSLLRAGRADHALAALEEEIAAARERAELQFAPELHRLAAEIQLEQDRLGEAEESFDRAIALARDQQALMLELRATVGAGRLWQRTGRADLARERLTGLYQRFTEGFSTPDLQAARQLLEALSGAPPPAAARLDV
jgi:class 3 adenylate cyclase/tetratricopeptide (TPR) repeat protein